MAAREEQCVWAAVLELITNVPPPARLAFESAVVACHFHIGKVPPSNERLEARVALVDTSLAGVALFARCRVRYAGVVPRAPMCSQQLWWRCAGYWLEVCKAHDGGTHLQE